MVELVVAIAVIGILLALLIPAVASGREAARRTQCASHLHQIGVALSNFETHHRRFPKGPLHKYDLLPFLELQPLHDAVKRPGGPFTLEEYWAPITNVVVDVYVCPNDGPDLVNGAAASNYAGCFGSGMLRDGENGFFEVDSKRGVRVSEFFDGLSNTVAMAEILHGNGYPERLRAIWQTPVTFWSPDEQDVMADYCDSVPPDPVSYGWVGLLNRALPWHDGDRRNGLYNHALTPNRPSCTNGTHVPTGTYTATSSHPGGVNGLFADGRVSFTNQGIDRKAWRALGARNDTMPGH